MGGKVGSEEKSRDYRSSMTQAAYRGYQCLGVWRGSYIGGQRARGVLYAMLENANFIPRPQEVYKGFSEIW